MARGAAELALEALECNGGPNHLGEIACDTKPLTTVRDKTDTGELSLRLSGHSVTSGPCQLTLLCCQPAPVQIQPARVTIQRVPVRVCPGTGGS